MRAGLVLFCAVLAAPAGVWAEVSIHAVLVGNNRSTKRSLPVLRYADDDVAKFYELLEGIGGRTRLLTVMDAETQQRFVRVRGRARAPRRREVLAALREAFASIREANRRGERTVFYFVFSGHGDVDPTGQGQIHLLDGMFTRGDLFRHVVSASPAKVNHLIIDACQAYFLVHRKGGWRDDKTDEEYGDLLRRFLQNEQIERFPNTGVLLATSTSAETHEWSRIESGLFSHQIRSGMTGAADVTGDGQVTYSELTAYIEAANARVSNQRARLTVFARPPAQHIHEPVVRLPANHVHRLQLARPLKGHFYIEDGRGARYADFHKSDEAVLTVVLVPASERYYLRSNHAERIIQLVRPPTTIQVAQLGQPETVVRGAVDEALRRGLFAEPYGPSYHAGFLSAWRRMLDEPLPPLARRDPAQPRRWRLGAGYLLSRPVLAREGLAHGIDLRLGRRLRSWLELGLSASYLAADGGDDSWRQHRLTVEGFAASGLAPLPWLRLRAELGLGYLALFEQVAGRTRGDTAAMTLHLQGGPEIRLHRWLWLALGGGVALDLFESDGAAETRVAPLAHCGLVASF